MYESLEDEKTIMSYVIIISIATLLGLGIVASACFLFGVLH